MTKPGDNVEVRVNAEGDADLGRIRGEGKDSIIIHDPNAPKPNWSFAVITDLHIGYDSLRYGSQETTDPDNDDYDEIDYAGKGWDDSEPAPQEFNYEKTDRLANVIYTINKIKDDPNNNIMFVVVLGDISDTAEKSEFYKARELLNRLNNPNSDGNTDDGIPYVPLIGNHDTWPYTQDLGPYSKKDKWNYDLDERSHYASISDFANGDRIFKEVFWEDNSRNINLIKEYFGDSWDSIPIEGEEPYTFILDTAQGNEFYKSQKGVVSLPRNYYLQNYGFVYDDITFIALDLAPRLGEDRALLNGDALPGASPEGAWATMHTQTLDFLKNHIKEQKSTIILTHYPLWERGGFLHHYGGEIGKLLMTKKAGKTYNFAGHTHRNWPKPGEKTGGHIVSAPVYPDKCPTDYCVDYIPAYEVIETEPVSKIPLGWPESVSSEEWKYDELTGKSIRIVRVMNDGRIDYSTVLEPPEPLKGIDPPPHFAYGPLASYPEPNKELFFTPYFTTYYGYNTSFDWDFGDGSNASGFSVSHIYPKEGEYNVTLTVNTTNLVTGEIRTYTVTNSVYVHSKRVISSLPSELNITSLITEDDLTKVPKNVYVPALISKNASEEISVADIGVHFEQASENISLSTLIADTNLTERKSVIYMPSWPPEIETFKSLFIPSTGVGAVYIFKNATSLENVSLENADFVINVGETIEGTTLSTVFYNGREYYEVSGVTGTGGGEAPSQHPFAFFTYIPEFPVTNETIIFNASSSSDPDGNITKYEWNFDDGNITNTTIPIITHSYQLAGNYTVTLNVTDNTSIANSTSKIITIQVPKFNLSGYKINDTSGNGAWDAGEAGIAGWNITLRNATTGAVIASSLTDASGFYQFQNLAQGSYNITEEDRAGWNHTNASFSVITLNSDITNLNFTNKLIPQPGIYSVVFNDTNGNRIRDAGEEGLAGWNVRLMGYDPVKRKFINVLIATDADGKYSVTGLGAGNYFLMLGTKPGWKYTTPTFRQVKLSSGGGVEVNFGVRK